MKFGKRDVAKMLSVLDPEYAEWVAEIKRTKAMMKAGVNADGVEVTEEGCLRIIESLEEKCELAEEFGRAALDVAMGVIEGKAKFTVVGQVKTKEDEPPGDKIALGWYVTEGQATEDALRLTYSTQTHEEHHAWVLPVFHGTPAGYYATRKADIKQAERMDKSFWEREIERRVQWVADHPGQPTPAEWRVVMPYYTRTETCPFCEGAGQVPIEGSNADD